MTVTSTRLILPRAAVVPGYRMHVDETGDHGMQKCGDEHHRFLSLTGVILARGDWPALEAGMTDLKGILGIPAAEALKHALHRKELVNGVEPFDAIKDPIVEMAFNAALIGLVDSTPFVAITAVIDKKAHFERYGTHAAHPYHYCMEVLLERYSLYLRDINGHGDVTAEARGKVEDRQLAAAFKHYCTSGTGVMAPTVMKQRLTSNELKCKPKVPPIAGLELADLLAHPAWKAIQAVEANLALPATFGGELAGLLISKKFRRSARGRIKGYGYKWLG